MAFAKVLPEKNMDPGLFQIYFLFTIQLPVWLVALRNILFIALGGILPRRAILLPPAITFIPSSQITFFIYTCFRNPAL